ncbi:MAG: Stage sporulation protein, partial [Verrucomicrobiota bacterium]
QFWRSGVKDNHTWFISFAPFENPEYVVVVFVQGAKSGGGVSAPIAAKILDGIQKYKSGKEDIQLAALEPAKGNFLFTESVDFGREVAAANKLFDDGETAESPSATGQENRPAAEPTVRADADEAGRVQNKNQPRVEKAQPATTGSGAQPGAAKPKSNPIGNLFNFLGGKKEKSKETKPEKKENR